MGHLTGVRFAETFPRRHIAALLIWQAALATLWLAGYTR